MRLQEKIALITGASGGIGKETALLFAKEGARVVAVDINDEVGNQLVELIRSQGGKAIYAHADISKSEDCRGMIHIAEKTFGRLDVLFNNAGVMHSEDDDAVNTSEEVWEATLSINLKGVFLGCKFGIPALRRAGGGIHHQHGFVCCAIGRSDSANRLYG